MAKPLHEILAGVKSSKVEKLDHKDMYKWGSPDGEKFVDTDHPVEKHEDRAGNKDDVYKGTTKKAPYKGSTNEALQESKKDNKAKKKQVMADKPKDEKSKFDPREAFSAMRRGRKIDESCCNESPKGVKCEVHGDSDCTTDKSNKVLLLDKKKR